MTVDRTRKALTLVVAAGLVSGALVAGPAVAKKPKKCPAFKPVKPVSPSGETAEVLEAEVVKVTDAATADKPIVMEYSHGPALWNSATQEPIVEDTVFFNIQIQSKQAAPALNVFQQWAARPPSDMDLFMYEGGEQIAFSGSANALPTPSSQVPYQGTGAWGLESIPGFATYNCAGYTIESRAFQTAGEDMTLTIWLAKPPA